MAYLWLLMASRHTGVAGWDDTCNWGEETKATEADEPASIQPYHWWWFTGYYALR